MSIKGQVMLLYTFVVVVHDFVALTAAPSWLISKDHTFIFQALIHTRPFSSSSTRALLLLVPALPGLLLRISIIVQLAHARHIVLVVPICAFGYACTTQDVGTGTGWGTEEALLALEALPAVV